MGLGQGHLRARPATSPTRGAPLSVAQGRGVGRPGLGRLRRRRRVERARELGDGPAGQQRLVGEVDREPRLHATSTNGVPNPLPVFAKPFALSEPGDQGAAVHDRPRPVRGQAQRQAGRRRRARARPDLVLRRGQLPHLRRHAAAASRARTCSASRPAAAPTSASSRAGRYFFQNNPAPVYGAPKAIAQLELTYADGSKQTIASDTSWRTAARRRRPSPSWWSGEDYDARRQPTDWTRRRHAQRLRLA